MTLRRSMRILLASVVFTTAVAAGPPADAAPRRCTYAEAWLLHQAFIPIYLHQPRDTEYPACQFRLYLDGEEVSFRQRDWFLAGIVLYLEYEALGISRQAGIAELERVDVRLWFSEVLPDGELGAPEEQTLMETSYRTANPPDLGRVVYRDVGVIKQLPVGDYVSTEQLLIDGDVVETSSVTVHIVP